MLIATSLFAILVVAGCSFADRIGRMLGAIDHPDGIRKRHARPTPLVGGIVLVIPLAGIAAYEVATGGPASPLLGVLGPIAVAFMVLGWADDRYHLPPGLRLVISTSLCTAVVVARPEFQLSVLTLGPVTLEFGSLALPFTVLCLVGLQNAVNMADGLNGLVIGLSIFWVACLLVYATPATLPFLALLLLGLLILLPFNLSGRLFLGDSGSYTLAILIGALMVDAHAAAESALPTSTVLLWLLVPTLDCLRVIVARLYVGRSPVTPDRNHLHHRIVRHWPWPVSVLTYIALAAGPGSVAALWPSATAPMLVLSLLAYTVVIRLTRPPLPALAIEQRDLPLASS